MLYISVADLMHQVLERLEEDYNSAEFEGNVVEQVSASLYFMYNTWEDTKYEWLRGKRS